MVHFFVWPGIFCYSPLPPVPLQYGNLKRVLPFLIINLP